MSALTAFRFDTLMHPWALLLLAAVAALLAAECVSRAPGALRISTGETMARMRGHWRLRLRRVPAVLRALGLALLVLALARPLRGYQLRPEVADVVDIMLCVDVSGSMRAMDFVAGDQYVDRLYVTKAAVQNFIDDRKLGGGRFGVDRLGLVLYAGYAWTQCPLTLDYGVLEHELELAHIDEENPRKRGTAIGSAIGLAVGKLRKSEADSKVIILLTDGINNMGQLDPVTAAGIAKDYGIRIYTIGAGTEGDARIPRQGLFGQQMVPVNLPLDAEMLERIASETGGKFFRATDTDSLANAYAEINKLETTEIEIGDFYEYEEGFVPWAVAGALLVAMSALGRRLWFEPIP